MLGGHRILASLLKRADLQHDDTIMKYGVIGLVALVTVRRRVLVCFSVTTTASSLTPRLRVHLPPSLTHQQRLMERPHAFSSRNSLHRHSQLLRDMQMVMLPPLRACFRKGGSLSRS